jgi:hypothetical protein
MVSGGVSFTGPAAAVTLFQAAEEVDALASGRQVHSDESGTPVVAIPTLANADEGCIRNGTGPSVYMTKILARPGWPR